MAKKLQILRGTTAQNNAYTGSIGELTMDTEKVEVRIHDGITQGGKTIGSGGANLPILTHVFSDHKLNDISWLNADTFSWQSGDVYVAAFEHLVNDYMSLSAKGTLYAWTNTAGDETYYTKTSTPSVGDQLFDETGTPAIVSNSYVNGEISVVFVYADGSITYARTDPNAMLSRDTSKDVALSTPASETETVDDITITFYRAEDGHKICLADQESNVQRLYDWMGVAWYYILDQENKRFKLPRTKFGFTGLRDSVGGYVPAGLPNITGRFYVPATYGSATSSGVFNAYNGGSTGSTNTAEKAGDLTVQFNASRSSSVYGNSNTVQPEATQMYLYFYVGNFEREAIEQTAGLSAELFNGKADTSSVQALESRTDALEEHDYVVASQKPTSANGYTWFRKYKSGWVEQGVAKGVTGGGSIGVTLPVPMADANYTILVSQNNSDGGGVYFQCQYHTPTATGFKVISQYGSSRTSRPFLWYVCGMAA